MTDVESLTDEISSKYMYLDSKSTRQPSKAMRVDGSCAVFFNSAAFDTQAERRVALAHELGHCETGSFYNVYGPYDVRERNEYRANKYAVSILVPPDKLLSALHYGCRNVCELADYLGITEDFARTALEIYLRVAG